MVLNDLCSLWAVEGLCYTVSHLNMGRKLSDLLGYVVLEMLRAEKKLENNHSDDIPNLLVLSVENPEVKHARDYNPKKGGGGEGV